MSNDEAKEAIKQVFGVDSRNQITNEMLSKHFKELANNKELAKYVWQGRLDFVGSMKEAVGYLKEIIEKGVEDNSKNTKVVFDACNGLIEIIQGKLKGDISTQESEEDLFSNYYKLIDIMKDIDLTNKKFLFSSLKTILQCVVIVAVISAGGYGIKKLHDAGIDLKL